jgi:hypothetical protein
MATLIIHAGDFNKGKAKISFKSDSFTFIPNDGHNPAIWTYFPKEIDSLMIATEENVKKISGTIGWGVAGAMLLGPVGLLAGLLVGGKKKDITFIMTLTDGKKMLATTDSKTYTQLTALSF